MAKKKSEVPAKKKRYATHVTTPKGGRVYISAKTQEELDKKVLQAKLEMGAGVDIADDTLFNDYALIWLETYKAPPKLRPSSYNLAKWNLEHNILPFFEGKELRNIKPIHIQAFLGSISRLSASVQSQCIGLVRGIFNSAVDNALILKSPLKSSDKPTGRKSAEKVALSNEQAGRLLAATKGTQAYLFCLLALATGMRKGEILGLMWEDIDFDNGFIMVTHSREQSEEPGVYKIGTMLKSASAHRKLPMINTLKQALEEERLRSNSDFVISMPNGQFLTEGAFHGLWWEVTSRTATENMPIGTVHKTKRGRVYTVSLDFKCHPHLLRHTFITQLFESGMDLKQVQYLAGHASPNMTLQVYTHYRRASREQETADQVMAAVSYLDK